MPKSKTDTPTLTSLPYELQALTWLDDHSANKEGIYCYCGKNKGVVEAMLACSSCRQLFHSNCVKCLPKPLLAGDVFYTFTCSVCNNGTQLFTRSNMSWQVITHLTIYNLLKRTPEKEYVRWKEDICSFVEMYWEYFKPGKPKSPTWHNTVASVLSTAQGKVFKSGTETYGQPGFWTLQVNEPPPPIISKGTPVKSVLRKPTRKRKTPPADEVPIKLEPQPKKKKEGDVTPKQRSPKPEVPDTPTPPTIPQPKSHPPSPIPSSTSTPIPPRIQDLFESGSELSDVELSFDEKGEEDDENDTRVKVEDDGRVEQPQKPTRHPPPQLLTPSEEYHLLNRLIPKTPPLRRLHRKLSLRRLKRSLGLPLFDLDGVVSRGLRVGGFTVCPKWEVVNVRGMDTRRAIERFKAVTNVHTTSYTHSFLSRLYGDAFKSTTLVSRSPRTSPYTGHVLAPYIWRDRVSNPPWKSVLEMWSGEKGSIDYVYLEKGMLEQVNGVLCRMFWPDIDVSENLLYPDFSIVALYKRVVVGCAFMTPEGYISYIAVRPGWGSAGIGRFMLFHLIQVAGTRDVTLHVSANNKAMVLYQRLGFKPEEFIVGFYDKYLPAESKECKNAFFVRLRR
ncbi:uncharacterized protein SPPG_07270 [Spizellomyces punctatus DAOM BR117]|uniref:N-acetyltransferase domain-containing protein n=1 Tax=Spizellomyces punctatus (strain DAOM BR117) TaxID=645134 RepID=A0A0L0H7Y8_SPIPD|nr:uncharacterized protein SPPG_07270 [Spizellomyces punctatus DAOM BR117]KNC97342.1 hypothetical protein SPPG_07270 [Spizellomyces punctatus DAOM BR117]|eukprot:XP_016605382.1 hypothetical protein SPPG_07270 [Spizellomyces punctatus DAOM BR117]